MFFVIILLNNMLNDKKLKIVKWGFAILGIYTLYLSLLTLINPWTIVGFMELLEQGFSLESFISFFLFIYWLLKPFLYFLISYYINKNNNWSRWLAIVVLLPELYINISYLIRTFDYYSYEGFDVLFASRYFYATVFALIFSIWSLFAIIVLFRRRNNYRFNN